MTDWPIGDKRVDVPVFPLPKLVLFPGTVLPVHIFEPRYREMIADCLVADPPLIAVAQLKPGWEPLYEGRPPIYDVAGVGQIKQHSRNPDGTYEIMIDAIARAHLHELPTADKSYRRACATVLNERVPRAGLNLSDVHALFSLATQIAALVKRALPDFTLQASAGDAPGLLADRVADQLVLDPAVRQDLLETLDLQARLHTLSVHLSDLYTSLSASEPAPPHTLH
jgi:hypothetical protein